MSTSTTQQESTPHHKPLRREDLVLEELDGEAVLYDPRCGAVHRFDALTLFVWKACDGSHTAADITHSVTAAYDVSPDEAFGHVTQLIAGFCTRDLLANGCATAGKVPAESAVGTGTRALEDRTEAARAGRQTGGASAPAARNPSPHRLLSRRAVLRGGATKLAYAAPVISTFFARPACASNPIHPAASAFGAGGCKNIGYSCVLNADCCEGETNTACQDQGGPTKMCCVQHNKTGCVYDRDCCNAPDVCNAGQCN